MGPMRRVPWALCATLVLALGSAGCDNSFGTAGSSTTSPSPAPSGPRSIVVAVDGLGVGDAGFNPHLVADLSEVTQAVASLTLPSPFRPVSDPSAPGGVAWRMDRSFVESVDVVGHAPLTVRYRVRSDAQWSDGAPIAAEDFQYLWRQMTTQPGVVDPGGYGLIDDIRSGPGGKEVTVVFRDDYSRWQELFTNLLPAHVGRDNVGGFARAFENGITVAGGSFRVDSMDRGKEEVVLVRNDRYWDSPAWADRIVLRRVGSGTQIAAAMRGKETQLALVHGGQTVLAQLKAIPQVRAEVLAGRRALRLTLNARDKRLGELAVRQALLGVLDQGLLAQVGAQDGISMQIGGASGRQAISPAQAQELLRKQGYGPLPPSAAAPPSALPVWGRGGQPLALAIGVAENDVRAIAVAGTMADQWRAVGVLAAIVQLPPDELYSTALQEARVQAVVGWSEAGGDLATALYSRYSCPPGPGGDGAGEAVPAVAPVSVGGVRNLSGLCAPEMQADFADALAGRTSADDLLAKVDQRLDTAAVELPILQDAGVLAVGPDLTGVDLAAPPVVGPMAGAASWEFH